MLDLELRACSFPLALHEEVLELGQMGGQDKGWLLPWSVHVCCCCLEMLPGAECSQSRLLDQLRQLAVASGVLLRVRSTSCPGSKGPGLLWPGRDLSIREDCTCLWGCNPPRWCSRAVSFPANPCHCAGPALGWVTAGGTTGWEGRWEQEVPLPAGFTQTSLGLCSAWVSSRTRANLCCLFCPPARGSSWDLPCCAYGGCAG